MSGQSRSCETPCGDLRETALRALQPIVLSMRFLLRNPRSAAAPNRRTRRIPNGDVEIPGAKGCCQQESCGFRETAVSQTLFGEWTSNSNGRESLIAPETHRTE